jgi:hypothetical protein
MSRFIDSLVHTDVINLKVCREVITISRGETAATVRIAAFKTITIAAIWAWGWKSPFTGYSSVHEQIHGLTWDLSSHFFKTFPRNAINKYSVRIPLYVAP